MQKIYLSILGCVALAMQVSAQNDVTRARWRPATIVIDGNDNDWKKPLNLYDEKSGITYAISNDKSTLYFDFAVGDPMKMRKMMSAGWFIELTSKEKGNKFKAAIIFPEVKLPGAHSRRSAEEIGERGQDNPAIRSYELMLGKVALKGFRSAQTETTLRKKEGIDIAVGENNEKQMVCEIAIPLTELFPKNEIHLNELMTLNVLINGLVRPTEGGGAGGGFEREAGGFSRGGARMGGSRGVGGRMGGGGSGFGGGGGGEMHGMQGGSRGGEGMGDRAAMFEKTAFKQKFKLTDN